MKVWQLPRILFQPLSSVQETRPVALVTSREAWAATSQQLNLPLVIRAEPTRTDRDFLDSMAAGLPSLAEVIYVVGEGAIVDIGRYIAYTNAKPLVIVPTALNSDEPFIPTTTVINEGRSLEIATEAADDVIIDLVLIRSAPAHLRTAALADVLSIFTGLLDWAHAAQQQRGSDAPFVPWAASVGTTVAAQAVKLAPSLGAGNLDAMHTLVNLLCTVVQIENQLGHRRLSHGIEHLFADVLDQMPEVAVLNISHAEKIAVGTLLSMALYGKDVDTLRTAFLAGGLRLDQIPTDIIRKAFLQLSAYAVKTNAPYTILNTLESNSDAFEEALAKSSLFPVA